MKNKKIYENKKKKTYKGRNQMLNRGVKLVNLSSSAGRVFDGARMIAKAEESGIKVTIKGILLRGSKNGEGTTTPSSMSSFEFGGNKDIHKKLGSRKETPPLYIPNETAEAGPRNN